MTCPGGQTLDINRSSDVTAPPRMWPGPYANQPLGYRRCELSAVVAAVVLHTEPTFVEWVKTQVLPAFSPSAPGG